MAIPYIERFKTSMAGEFLVAGILCAKGHVASLTLKNYPRVDIFVLRDDGVQRALQVKASRQNSVNFGAGGEKGPRTMKEKLEIINKKIEHTHIFVRLYGDNVDKAEFYIVPAKSLRKELKKQTLFWIHKADHPRSKITEDDMGRNNIAVVIKRGPKKYPRL